MANNLFEGEAATLQFLLQDNGKTLNDARFLRLLNIQAELAQGDRVVWSEKLSDSLPPGDGIYRRELNQFDREGEYQLRVQVDGKSFSREISHRFAVRGPFAAELLSPNPNERLLRVRANGQALDKAKTVVVAKVKEPNGRASIQPLQLSPSDSWELSIKPDQEGRYSIDLRVSAVDLKGESFDHHPAEITFSFPDGADPFVASEAEPEALPLVEPEASPEPTLVAPVEPSADEPAVQVPDAVEPEPAAAPTTNWILYGALGLGNLLILALAYFAYRTVMGGKKVIEEEDDKEIEATLAAEDAAADEVPPLEDLGAEEDTLADSLMAPLDETTGMAAIDIENENAADEVATDDTPEFSLDDLAPGKDDDK